MTINPEYQPHFNKCAECGQEPEFHKFADINEIHVYCPGKCLRLFIRCRSQELAETIWNTANPANVSHATALSENPEIHEWKHGGDPEPEDPATDKETADEDKSYYDRQFDLYNLGREIDILRDRVNAADSVAAVASMDNDSTYDVDAFHYINSALSQIRSGLDFLEQEIKK